MTLIATAELPSRSTSFSFCWVLPMRTEDMTGVRIVVLDEALSAFEVQYENKIPQLEGEHRSRIENIASAKYDGGFTEQDGSVHVTLADID